MTTRELESLAEEFIHEKFVSEVKPFIDAWIKEHGFKSIKSSMGGYVLTKDNGDTLFDEDLRDSDNSEYVKFYKDYIELITYCSETGNSILYSSAPLL